MSQLFTLIIVFLAIFTQSLTGFGSGLVSMAFLPEILGVRTAVPLVVLVTGTLEAILLVRYRSAFNLQGRLAAHAGVGIWHPGGGVGVARPRRAGLADRARRRHGRLRHLRAAEFQTTGAEAPGLGARRRFFGRYPERRVQRRRAASNHLWELPALGPRGIQEQPAGLLSGQRYAGHPEPRD